MPRVVSFFAIGYSAVVLMASGWAIYTDITLLHSQLEHLLPDLVLVAVGLPLSFSIFPLYDVWPEFFSNPFIQVGWAALCGLGQAALLFFYTRTGNKGSPQLSDKGEPFL